MEDYRLVAVLAGWLFAVLEGTVWLLVAYAVSRLFPSLSSSARAWFLRIAFLKFWLTVAALIFLPLLVGTAVVDLAMLAEFVVGTSPLLHALALSGLSGIALLAVTVLWMHVKIGRLASASTRLEELTQIEPYVRLAKPFECWHVPIVFVSDRRSSPALVGLWRQAVLLPAKYVGAAVTDQGLAVLAHELAHVKRRDPLWSLLVLTTVAAMPWNPLVHLAAARYRDLVEAACDELVLRTGAVDQSLYARTLALEATSAPTTSRIEGLAFGAPTFNSLTSRLEAIAAWTGQSRRPSIAAGLIVLGLAVSPSFVPVAVSDWRVGQQKQAMGVPDFDVVWIDVDPSLGPARAWEVNSKGQVAVNANWRKPYLWSAAEGLVPLTADQYDSQVDCINESGVLGGADHRRMGVFKASPAYDPLKSQMGHVWDVSDSGFVVGRWDKDVPTAFRFHPDTGLEEVPVPKVYPQSNAGGTNNFGHVVGVVTEDHFQLKRESIYFWDGEGEVVLLPAPNGFPITAGGRINDSRLIVGVAKDASVRSVVPVAWPSPTSFVRMGQLALAPNASPAGITASGWCVGLAWSYSEFEATAALWSPDFRVIDLNDCVDLPRGWRLTESRGIADNMLIVATARKGGLQRAVLLKPRVRR